MLFLHWIVQCTHSSVVSSAKSHESWSDIGEITCTLGKSLCSWRCWVDSCRSQKTPWSRGHAMLWYIISLCAALYTPSVKLATLSDLPWKSVMLHSLQCGPIVPPWGRRDTPECRWLVAQCNRVRGGFSAEAHYGLSHYGKKPNTTSGSRWSKGKANINSYDCWLYS